MLCIYYFPPEYWDLEISWRTFQVGARAVEAMSAPKTPKLFWTCWESLIFPSFLVYACQIQWPTCASRTSDNDVSLICCHCIVLLSFCVAFPSAISGKCFLEVSFCFLAVCCPLLGHMSQNPLPCSILELFCSLSTKHSLRFSTLPTFILSFSHSANTYWGYSICQELYKASRYKDKQT